MDRMKYVTWGSLALNVFLIGATASHFLRGHDHRRRRGPDLGAFMEEHKDALRQQRRAVREAGENVEHVLTKDPLDQAELDAALAHLRTTSMSAHEALHAALSRSAKDMPLERRRELARALGKRPPPRGPR